MRTLLVAAASPAVTTQTAAECGRPNRARQLRSGRLLWLLLFFCCCVGVVTASISSDSATRVQYLFVTHAGSGALPLSAPDPDGGVWTQIYAGSSSPGAPHVDDAPLWPLELGFDFSFNARPFHRVFVSPNGYAAFQNDEPQCCTMVEDPSLDAPAGAMIRKCFQSPAAPACNFNSSYSNVIAVFLADLNPGLSADARISFLSTARAFKVRWTQLPFFQRSFEDASAMPPPVTMQMELFASGAIVLRLIDVADPNAGIISGGADPGTAANQAGADEQLRPWIAAALRFDTSSTPASIEQTIAPLFDELSNSTGWPERSLYAAQAAFWSTSHTAGVYLERSQPSDPLAVNSSTGLVGFRSDMRVEYCTASVLWAISPPQGSVAGGDNLHVTAADLSCFEGTQGHRAQCRFYPCAAAAAGGSGCIAGTFFLATVAAFDPTSRSLRCLTPAASDFAPAGSMAAGSLLQLRLFDSDAAMELASASPMIFRFLSAPDAATFLASVPTLENPGPQSEDLQLIRLGVYALLCNDTAHVHNSLCARDCAGVFSGLAALDSCGVCAGGTSGRVPDADFDCAGRCFVDRSFSASARANASYCVCENTNLTSLVHSSFLQGLRLSDAVQSVLSEGGCARESYKPISSTLAPTWWYRFGLLGLALAGFALVGANDKVRARCACCSGSCCQRAEDDDQDGFRDEEGDEEEDANEEAAMRRREALALEDEQDAEDADPTFHAAAAAPLGSSASAIAAPPPRSLPQSLPAAASPMHIRWHVDE